MRHRRQAVAERTALFVFHAARLCLLFSAIAALLALVVFVCIAGTPAP